MASISLTDPVAGTTVTAGLHAGNNAALRTAINGGLDNTNVAGGAAIDQTKIAFTAWAAYSPAWTALTGSAPVLNNGTIAGRYAQVGKTVNGHILLTAGTTTTFGSGGIWAFSLPVAAHASYNLIVSAVGIVNALDVSAAAIYDGFFRLTTTTTATLDTTSSPVANFTAAAPVTWATGDLIAVHFAYEAA